MRKWEAHGGMFRLRDDKGWTRIIVFYEGGICMYYALINLGGDQWEEQYGPNKRKVMARALATLREWERQ